MRHLCLLVTNGLLVLAVHTSAQAASSGGGPGGWHDKQTSNWAGMLAQTGPADGIDMVTGAVIVPVLTCGAATSIVSVWIGVGGQTGSMPQIGFHGRCEGGRASYAGFFEWFDPRRHDNAAVELSGGDGTPHLVLMAGDLVSMTMKSTRVGRWHGEITASPHGGLIGADRSSVSFGVPRTHGSATGVGRTAECMVERTGRTGGKWRFELASFGTIQWQSCRMERLRVATGSAALGDRVSARVLGGAWQHLPKSDGNSYVALTSFGVARYTMFQGAERLASTRASARTSDTRRDDRVRGQGGFDVTWHASGVGPAVRSVPRRVVTATAVEALGDLLGVPQQRAAGSMDTPGARQGHVAVDSRVPTAVRAAPRAVATCQALQAEARTLRESRAAHGRWTVEELRRYRKLVATADWQRACALR